MDCDNTHHNHDIFSIELRTFDTMTLCGDCMLDLAAAINGNEDIVSYE